MVHQSNKHAQQGVTVLEMLGALAIAATLMMGLSTLIDRSVSDAKGQQVALYQQQAAQAAARYITANYAALVGATQGGTVAVVTLAQLKAGGYLSAGFAGTNAFRQTPCVLLRQGAAGKLDALVATHGGDPIPERDLAFIALQSGQGGGYIGTADPAKARGASWELATTPYRNVACGGSTVLTGVAAHDAGHLVSSLFYDGPGQLATDFLYRSEVAGRPELNRMSTTLHMMPGTNAQAVENDAGDPRCTAASGTGKIAIDANGRVLSCQAGVWKRQGSAFWNDPVASFGDLPASGNQTGEVRMVSGLGRAFTWNGAAWTALALDQDGHFLVPGTLTAGLVKLTHTADANTSCDDDGMLARQANGLLLSCQSGRWRNLAAARATRQVYQGGWELTPSNGPRVVMVDLNALPGSRPLYLTGYSTCHGTGYSSVFATVEMLDADGGTVAYAGGCFSSADTPSVGVWSLGDIGLQKIPENVTHLRLVMEPGTGPEDAMNLLVRVYSE